ncbi:MAG: hypothetical protein ABI378_12570 [Chitinophagaceae bacterium]
MMKKSLLTLAIAFSSISVFAQSYAPDFRYSVGVYGGLAPTSKFYNLVDYSPDEKSLPNMFGVVANYNILDRLQVGLDINTNSEWSSKGTSNIYGLDGTTLGNVATRYVYADRVFTTSLRVNGMVPLYDNMQVNRFNFYYGISIGAIFTVNDGKQTNSQFDELPGEQYRYVSEYHYEPAAGYTFGPQFGVEFYTPGRLGFSAEFAPRFSHLNTVDNRIAGRNGPYDLFSFPVSVGVRYRFGSGGFYRY